MQTGSGFTPQQINFLTVYPYATTDEALTWEQTTTTRQQVLDAASGWPTERRLFLAEFFVNLEAYKAKGSST